MDDDTDPIDKRKELDALCALLDYATLRADEIGAACLSHAIQYARKVAQAQAPEPSPPLPLHKPTSPGGLPK